MEHHIFDRLSLQLTETTNALKQTEDKLAAAENELKRLQELLQQSEAEKKQLQQKETRELIALDGSGDSVWEYNLITNESFFSARYKSLLGYAPNELENKTEEWRSRIHPEDIASVVALDDAYLTGQITSHKIEYRMRRKNGHYMWILDRGKIASYSSNGKPLTLVGTHTDINDRKHLQLRIQADASRLSSLMLHLPEAILLENEQHAITFVNQRFCDLFNIPTSPEGLTGTIHPIFSKEGQAFFKNPKQAFLQSEDLRAKKTLLNVERIETADGRFFEFSYIPLFSEEHFEGHLWVYQDVTEKLMNRRKIQDQRHFYEDILHNIPSDIVVLDTHSKFLFVSPRAVKDTQVREWMIGRTQKEYHAARPPRVQILAQNRQRQFEVTLESKKATNWEEEITTATGAIEYHIRNFFPVMNPQGDVAMIIAHSANITQRKNAERQIQISEKRYREIVNFSQAIIITHDKEGNIQMMNPAGYEALGYTQQEIQGKSLMAIMAVSSETALKRRYLDPLLLDKKAEGVFIARHKDGSVIHLLYKNHLLEEPGREPYIIAFAQNISHLVKAESELKMAKLLAENASTRTETFLANMSHEIRTPMNGILGIAALLKKTSLNEQQKRYLGHIQDSANNLLVIVNDVLDLEKIVAGKLELESIPFVIEDKVGTVIETFRYKAEEKGIILRWNNNLPNNLAVIGDPFRLGQILNNIISNALKFTSKGSITVTAGARKQTDGTIKVDYSVADTGIGIEASQLQRVFTPYVQEKTETARKYGGTGLGLSISKNLVEMQGGNISVESEPGQGTTFSFEILYQPAPVQTQENTALQARQDFSRMKGVKVLVAEDVELNQFLARHILESWGAVVTIVDNGEKAIECMRQKPIDIVLMDIQMPVMGGIQATGKIRELPPPACLVPIVALTANALKGDSDKYIAAGMDSYLSKPFTEEQLFGVMDDMLQDNIKNLPHAVTHSVNTPVDLPTDSSVFDLTGLETATDSNQLLMQQIMEMFLKTSPAIVMAINTAVEQKNKSGVANEAHKLRPQAKMMGVVECIDLLPEMELAAKADDPFEKIEALNKLLQERWPKAMQQMQEWLNNQPQQG